MEYLNWKALGNPKELTLCLHRSDALLLHQHGITAHPIPETNDWLTNDYQKLKNVKKFYFLTDENLKSVTLRKNIAARLGVERCYNLPDCRLEGFSFAPDAVDHLYKYAETATMDTLMGMADFEDDVMDEFFGTPNGWTSPWPRLNKLGFRFSPSEVTVWTGKRGSGKSAALGEVVMYIAKEHGQKACIASLEMPSKKTIKRMVRQALGARPKTQAEVKHALWWMKDYFIVYHHLGLTSAEQILRAFKTSHEQFGTTQFILDSWMMCGISEKDIDAQADFAQRCVDFVNMTESHLHVVAHPRKLDDSSMMPTIDDVRGSSAITDKAHNVITIWRNFQKEEARAAGDVSSKFYSGPDSILRVEKNREDGIYTKIQLSFLGDSLQFSDEDESVAISKYYCAADASRQLELVNI